MNAVTGIFYWGGNMVQDPIEGISYDSPAKAMHNIQLATTLAELNEILNDKVLKYGEFARLKLTCRFPLKSYQNTTRYVPLLLFDEDSFRVVLSRVHKTNSCLQIYIDKEPISATNGNPQLGSMSFSQLLTQGTCSNIVPSPASQIPQQSRSYQQRPIHYTQPTGECHAGTSASGGVCPLPSRVAMEECDRFYEVNDVIPTEASTEQLHNQRFPSPPLFFTNIEGNDDSICRRDIIIRGPKWNASNAKLSQGMLFPDKATLKYAVKVFHLRTNREYVVVDSRKKVWILKCKHDCPWRLRAIQRKKSIFFEITQYPVLSHNCVYERGNRDHSNLDARFIAQVLKTRIEEDPDMPLVSIIANIKTLYTYTISYKKAWLGRTKAIKILFGDWDASYKKLPTYLNALKVINPGTIVEQVLKAADTPGEVQLQYLFWAFRPCIDGFQFCPPVICIDGTHLYGKYKGKMLAAVGCTVAGNLFPLAFALVDEETTEAWSWFIFHLRTKVVPGRPNLTLISGRGQGVLNAVQNYWETPIAGQPIGYHRWCLRHVCNNFNTYAHDAKLKDLLWKAGSAHQRRKLNDTLQKIEDLCLPDEIGQVNQAWKWIVDHLKNNFEKWTLSHDGGRRWGVLTTNNAEYFKNFLKGVRNLPPTACVQLTFYRMVKYFNKYRTLVELDECNQQLIPRQVHDKIFAYQTKGNSYHCECSDRARGMFEVMTTHRGERGCTKQVVKLNTRECTCGKYNTYKYPCSHMIAVSEEMGCSFMAFIDDVYKLGMYKRVWERFFEPMSQEWYWPKLGMGPIWIADPVRRREVKLGGGQGRGQGWEGGRGCGRGRGQGQGRVGDQAVCLQLHDEPDDVDAAVEVQADVQGQLDAQGHDVEGHHDIQGQHDLSGESEVRSPVVPPQLIVYQRRKRVRCAAVCGTTSHLLLGQGS